MIKVIKECKLKLFADDALIYITGMDYESTIEKISVNFKVCPNGWKLIKLNSTSRQKYQIIGNRKYDEFHQVIMDGENLEKVNKVKYLGIILDSRISLQENVDFVTKKL